MEQVKIAVNVNLQKILETQEKLKKAKSQKITFSKPLLWQSGRPAIFPNTINVIQGQAVCIKAVWLKQCVLLF